MHGAGRRGCDRDSDRWRELVDRCVDVEPWEGDDAEFVVTSSEVLHERVTPDDRASRSGGLETTYRS